jgi:hypothetical protein
MDESRLSRSAWRRGIHSNDIKRCERFLLHTDWVADHEALDQVNKCTKAIP